MESMLQPTNNAINLSFDLSEKVSDGVERHLRELGQVKALNATSPGMIAWYCFLVFIIVAFGL